MTKKQTARLARIAKLSNWIASGRKADSARRFAAIAFAA